MKVMGQEPRDLSTAIKKYHEQRQRRGYSPHTRKNDLYILDRFLRITGNRMVAGLTYEDYDKFMSEMRKTRVSGLPECHNRVRQLFAFIKKDLKWVRNSWDPMGTATTRIKVPRREHVYLDRSQFIDLIETGWDIHPQVGMLCATGLFLINRGCESSGLRIGWVNNVANRITKDITKNGLGQKSYYINRQFRPYLDRWLAYYTEHAEREGLGPLQDDWYLIPNKTGRIGKTDPETGFWTEECETTKLRPTDELGKQAGRLVKQALIKIGIPEKNAEGKPSYIGTHTLRRSAARELAKTLRDRGVADYIGPVQELMGHFTRTQTENYIGMGLAQVSLDDHMRDEDMFDGLQPSLAKVTPIRRGTKPGWVAAQEAQAAYQASQATGLGIGMALGND